MFIASLLFGISASLDALLVGISYGLRHVRIRLWQNLSISLVTLLGPCLSVGLGRRLAAFLPDSAGEYAGSLVLILLGLYYMVKWTITHLRPKTLPNSFTEAGTPPVSAESDMLCAASAHCPRPDACLRPAEVLSLSLTLSLNNLSAGFSASLGGLPPVSAAASTFVCSVLFLFSGNCLGGCRWLQIAGCAAEPASGMLLIGLGLAQLFL